MDAFKNEQRGGRALCLYKHTVKVLNILDQMLEMILQILFLTFYHVSMSITQQKSKK